MTAICEICKEPASRGIWVCRKCITLEQLAAINDPELSRIIDIIDPPKPKLDSPEPGTRDAR